MTIEPVIASVAKQSSLVLDCRVAALLAKTKDGDDA